MVYAWGLNLVVLTLQIQPTWGRQTIGIADQYETAPKERTDAHRFERTDDQRRLSMAATKGVSHRWRRDLRSGHSAVHDKKFEFLLEALAPAA